MINDDLVMDLDAEGRPVGLDVQYASRGSIYRTAMQELVLTVTRGP